MRARLIFVATLGVSSMVACGGGGGGGGGGTPGTPATPTPTPTPIPTNNDFRPATTGDTFAYAGSMSVAFVRPPQNIGVIPSPNPGSSQTLSYTTTQNQTVTTGRTYNGVTNAVAFATVESDTLLGGLATTQTTSTEYYALQPAGSSTQVRDLGGMSSTSAGASFTTTLGAKNGLVDVLPEVAGIIPIASDASAVRTENDPSGQQSTRTTNADGTYTETVKYIDGTTATAVANADGSGSFSFPVGYPDNALFAVATPAPASSSSPNSTIPITITYPAGLIVTVPTASPTPFVRMRTVTTWYAQPIVFSTQSLNNLGPAAVPAACGVPSALLHSPPNMLVATSTTVDPVFGELDARTTSQYVEAGVGVVCVQLQDTLKQYYDFSEQTGQYVATQSAPVQTTTTTETLGLTSETVIGLASVGRSTLVGASRAHFASVLERNRALRHAAIARAVRTSLSNHLGGR